MNGKPTENLVVNAGLQAAAGDAPESWSFVSPRPALAPGHAYRPAAGVEPACLELTSNGDARVFGCWRGELLLEPGTWYRASVRARLKGIERPAMSVVAHVAKHHLAPRDGWSNDMVLEQVFCHDGARVAYNGNAIELYLRAAATGSVAWSQPRVERIEPPKFRSAKVATVRFGAATQPLTLEGQRERVTRKLDEAGVMRPDIVALPEFTPWIGVDMTNFPRFTDIAETVPDGPLSRIAAAKAKEYGMYVLMGNIEARGDYFFNSASLFDRQGNYIDCYDKTHLTFGEMTDGFSCGDRYPVFDLDFGRIAVHICYDEWFPEVARYYAHAGADILFLPVAGGKPLTWRTRALDNGIYFVASSINPPSMIIDSSGAIIAETADDGIACAQLNLDYRKTNAYIDPTLSYGMPCIQPHMRYCLDDNLLDDLHQAMLTGGEKE